jgi:hypothetical protein
MGCRDTTDRDGATLTFTAGAPSGLQPRSEGRAADSPLDQIDGACDGGELEPLRLVSREDPVDGVRRQGNAELNPRRPIPLPRALDTSARVVPRRRRQRRWVPPQHRMTPVIRREDIKQPGDFPDD